MSYDFSNFSVLGGAPIMPVPAADPNIFGNFQVGSAPMADPAAGGGFLSGFGTDDMKLALGGLETLGKLWGAFQSANLAKKQFNFTKQTTETNLANQIRSYNTSLDDRIRSRGVVEGQSPAQMAAYVEQHRARKGG